jgi:hypothetical protein
MSGKLVESLDASGTSWLVNCVLLWFDQPHGGLSWRTLNGFAM